MADERISTTRPVGTTAVEPNGQAGAQPAAGAKAKEKKPREPRDLYREIAETVVFVVVLVLMLKTFVAEAFVIPTGSMAETLYGYHKMVTCERCEYVFPLNCSSEVDPQNGVRREALNCRCPNCQHAMKWTKVEDGPSWSSGDRVLVAKFLFDNDHLWRPHRHEVFVFKYPREPQKGTTAWNYIKRCEGEPEETIAIFSGLVGYELETPHVCAGHFEKPPTCTMSRFGSSPSSPRASRCTGGGPRQPHRPHAV